MENMLKTLQNKIHGYLDTQVEMRKKVKQEKLLRALAQGQEV